MKVQYQRFLFLAFLGCLLTVLVPQAVEAQSPRATVEVYLVKAGNGDEGIDKALRSYAPTLKRLFRFRSYRLMSRGTLQVAEGGRDVVSFPGNQSLELQAGPRGKRGLPAEIHWKQGGSNLLHTRINLSPGNPAVLGGPRGKDGAWLLILRTRP